MREDARKRVTRESNRRLIDLFAEAGVGSVGLQWHQVGSVGEEGEVQFVNDPRSRIPHSTQLVVANLSDDQGTVVELETLAAALSSSLGLPVFRVNSSQLDGVFVKREDSHQGAGPTVADLGIQRIGMDAWSSLEDLLSGR